MNVGGSVPNKLDCFVRIAFRNESKEHSNYGRAVGWTVSDWWAAVCRNLRKSTIIYTGFSFSHKC